MRERFQKEGDIPEKGRERFQKERFQKEGDIPEKGRERFQKEREKDLKKREREIPRAPKEQHLSCMFAC